jgi:hypothetical protein
VCVAVAADLFAVGCESGTGCESYESRATKILKIYINSTFFHDFSC